VEIVVRASIIFLFLWIVTRALGKRELAQLSPFELVLLVVMGDLVQQGVTQNDHSITGAVLAVGTISLWILAFSFASYRWRHAAEVLDGVPSVVVQDGHPLDEVLRIQRMTIADLREAARDKGISDLALVRIALLEPDGTFSFITYDDKESPPEPERPAV
jgi:uncharacterized membrane protein YcaP (DUF421 family)